MDIKLTQAIHFFNNGQKQEALTLFTEILKSDPTNSTAWYGMALCQTEREKTIEYLNKTISLDPKNEKAKRMLDRLIGSKSTEGTEKASEIPPKKILSSPNTWLPYLFIVILAVAVVWLFFRMDKQEKQLVIASSQISTLDSQVKTANSQIRIANSNIQSIDSSIQRINSDLYTLDSGLAYATSLAENANNYAHSHNTYSDERLKSDITPIENALQGVLSLQGVEFVWTNSARSELNLPDKPQIGLIAQDVENVYPELVFTDIDGYKQIDYAKLTVILIEAVKEQQQIIDDLRFQIIKQ